MGGAPQSVGSPQPIGAPQPMVSQHGSPRPVGSPQPKASPQPTGSPQAMGSRQPTMDLESTRFEPRTRRRLPRARRLLVGLDRLDRVIQSGDHVVVGFPSRVAVSQLVLVLCPGGPMRQGRTNRWGEARGSRRPSNAPARRPEGVPPPLGAPRAPLRDASAEPQRRTSDVRAAAAWRAPVGGARALGRGAPERTRSAGLPEGPSRAHLPGHPESPRKCAMGRRHGALLRRRSRPNGAPTSPPGACAVAWGCGVWLGGRGLSDGWALRTLWCQGDAGERATGARSTRRNGCPPGDYFSAAGGRCHCAPEGYSRGPSESEAHS